LAARAGIDLPVDAAIRAAWANNAGLKAGDAMVSAARAEALSARDARLPTVEVHARALRTDEPVAAFGLKLDQGKITQADFDPARLNSPGAVSGVGFGASITQVLYAGGRVSAGRDAREAQAVAEQMGQQARKNAVALAVVEAYFGALVAEQASRFADEHLAWAREVERFVKARVAQAQLPEAEALRATAARAQMEAERGAVGQQLESARAGLSLLMGEPVGERPLSSPIPIADSAEPTALQRPDLEAARLRIDAARAANVIADGALLPQIFVIAGVDTMRSGLSQGNVWTLAAIGAKWELGVPAWRERDAARAREAAAVADLRWRQQQAALEADEARRAAASAHGRIAAAREAMAASESARELRSARHREGLLPLTEVLDAQAGVASARTLLLRSQLELRVAQARLQLALGSPIEGVMP
jgi:outer membrane protein TolC